MTKNQALPAVLALGLAVSGCGGLHTTVTTAPAGIVGLKQLTVAPVQVTSKEQTADAQKLNGQWKALAAEQLKSMLGTKGIKTASGDGTIECSIHVVYGSRALRYFVGFGAGAGSVAIDIALKGSDGTARYATRTEADLAGGGFGGDMAAVMRKAIEGAVRDFGSRL